MTKNEADPISDYLSEWITIYAKSREKLGRFLSEESVTKVTRDIIGPFKYWLDRNLEYYGFQSTNEYMQNHLVLTLEKIAMGEGEFKPDAPRQEEIGTFKTANDIPVFAKAGEKYTAIVSGKETYDHRKSLFDLGLRWNKSDKQWEAEMSVENIQKVKDFCTRNGLDFQVG